MNRSTALRRTIVTLPLVTAATLLAMVAACSSGSMSAEKSASPRTEAAASSPAPGMTMAAGAEGGAMRVPVITGPFDEVWVIATEGTRTNPGVYDVRPAPMASAEAPGCGAMVSLPPTPDGPRVPLPLAHTAVDGRVSGPITSVLVRQRFHNPFTTTIEAAYVFPLPHDAAVSDFVLTVGTRRIRGLVREREEAKRTYADAKAAGHVAALLTEERPNIFMERVANLEPGAWVDVEMTYYGTVGYDDGWHEWVFPMVVGPRFNPPGSAQGVGAVAAASPLGSGQPVDQRYLAPGQESGHFIDLSLDIDAGTRILDVRCPSHRVETAQPDSTRAVVRLAERDRTPDRDFVLRWKVAGQAPTAAFVSSRDADGGTFVLALYPPARGAAAARTPLDLVFVIDRSGSMSGVPFEQAKDAMQTAIGMLDDGDAIQIVDFADTSAYLAPASLPATSANRAAARRYVDGLRPGGGTMMLNGLRSALSLPADPTRVRHVVFLTDGFIGNEAEILAATAAGVGTARVFSFGVGSSVNRYLLDGMARLGRGTTTVLLDREDPRRTMKAFMERVREPAMVDVSIDWGSLAVREVTPGLAPDLHAGRPVVLVGRCDGVGAATIGVQGRIGTQLVRVEVPVQVAAGDVNPALRRIWARCRISEICLAALRGDGAELAPQRILATALDAGILSPYTAFIAVDASHTVPGGPGPTIQQAVPVPAGVRYDTTVGSAGGQQGGRVGGSARGPASGTVAGASH